MKKYFTIAFVLATVIFLSNCHSAKKAQAEAATIKPKVTYETDMQGLVAVKCSPCHFPSKGGNKRPFDSYDAVHANIDSMIARIQLMPGQKGFMPFKGQKLSDSVINVFKEWRAQGAIK
jgi:hypothetical protein